MAFGFGQRLAFPVLAKNSCSIDLIWPKRMLFLLKPLKRKFNRHRINLIQEMPPETLPLCNWPNVPSYCWSTEMSAIFRIDKRSTAGKLSDKTKEVFKHFPATLDANELAAFA